MIEKKTKYEIVDYIFWFLFVMMVNPGGIFIALGEDTSKAGSIDIRDLIFFLILCCYLLIFYKKKISHHKYHKIVKLLVIFGLYYLIVFGYFVPIFKESSGYSVTQFVKKSRKTIYSLVLFAIVYRFYLRSYILFYKTLILSSIIILALFFITFATGIEILPVKKGDRGFVSIDRVFIASEGFMMLLMPMGAALIVFKSKLKGRKLILIASLMMFINIVISITRRDIIGTLIYFIMAMILYNYIRHKPLIPIKKMLSVSVYLVFFGFFISLILPKYSEATVIAFEESINVVDSGKTSNGQEDVRMGLGKDFMQNLILSNPYFGTGFDNRWRGGGDKLGFETSDYPFLSAIAMYGIAGILVFLPIYLILVGALYTDIKYLRSHRIDYTSMEFFVFIVFIIYFIYNLLQYMNWFQPVSLSRSVKWYVYLAMYLASRQIFYHKEKLGAGNY